MRIPLLAAVAVVSACIEGPERDSVSNIEPRVCETGLRPDQAFVLSGRYTLERQQALETDPPRFVLDGPTGEIAMAAIPGEYGQLTFIPDAPLPPDADLTLRLVEPGALEGAYVPPMFPARYSTRGETTIRTFRATYRNIFVSFSQALDATTVSGSSVLVQRGTAPVTAAVQYLDASPGHVVHVMVYDDSPVEILFTTALRTSAGAAVFVAPTSIQVAPDSTLPEANGCESAE